MCQLTPIRTPWPYSHSMTRFCKPHTRPSRRSSYVPSRTFTPLYIKSCSAVPFHPKACFLCQLAQLTFYERPLSEVFYLPLSTLILCAISPTHTLCKQSAKLIASAQILRLFTPLKPVCRSRTWPPSSSSSALIDAFTLGPFRLKTRIVGLFTL